MKNQKMPHLEQFQIQNHRKGHIDIKNQTPVRGQDGKISDTQGKDFWSPTRLRRVGD